MSGNINQPKLDNSDSGQEVNRFNMYKRFVGSMGSNEIAILKEAIHQRELEILNEEAEKGQVAYDKLRLISLVSLKEDHNFAKKILQTLEYEFTQRFIAKRKEQSRGNLNHSEEQNLMEAAPGLLMLVFKPETGFEQDSDIHLNLNKKNRTPTHKKYYEIREEIIREFVLENPHLLSLEILGLEGV